MQKAHSSVDQTDVFREGEGDRWFDRNKEKLTAELAGDRVGRMVARLGDFGLPMRSVAELGCANGWRLAGLKEAYPGVARIAGADISEKAVRDGRARWPDIELHVASVDEPALPGRFDVVILSFVLHWVSRERLAASIAAIDRLVYDGGCLIIADFLPDRPSVRRYHHLDDVEVQTYKQDYAACFSSLGFYEELARDVYAHDGGAEEPTDQNRAACTLLRKSVGLYAPA